MARSVAAVAARATGGEPPRIFTTLGRHRRLFRWWLPFAATLLLRGELPRRETELMILRTAHRTGCGYEWAQHVPLAIRAGVGRDAVERIAAGPEAPGWTPRERVLLRAADELLDHRMIGDTTWAELSGILGERELIELCLLVGHYDMLAMTLNSLGVEAEVQP
jgi:AhpD family alkylhydroperoxidase